MFQLVTSLLQLENELIETFVDVSSLLLIQSLDLGLDVVYELPVVIIDAFRVDHQLVEIVDVLLDDVRHIL